MLPHLFTKNSTSSIFFYVLIVWPFNSIEYPIVYSRFIFSNLIHNPIKQPAAFHWLAFFSQFIFVSFCTFRRIYHIQLKSSDAIPHNYLDLKRVRVVVIKQQPNVNVIMRNMRGRERERAHLNWKVIQWVGDKNRQLVTRENNFQNATCKWDWRHINTNINTHPKILSFSLSEFH